MSDFPASLNAPKAGDSGAQDQPDLLGDLITQFNIDFVKEEGQEGHQVQVCHLQIASENHLTTKRNPFEFRLDHRVVNSDLSFYAKVSVLPLG